MIIDAEPRITDPAPTYEVEAEEYSDNIIEIGDKHNLNYYHISCIFEKYPNFQEDLDQMEIDYKDFPDVLHDILMHVNDSWEEGHNNIYDDSERIENMYSVDYRDLERLESSYWTVYDFEREVPKDCRDRQDHVRSRILNISRNAPLHTYCYFVKLSEKYGVCQGLLMKIRENFPNFDFESEIEWTATTTIKDEHRMSYMQERLQRYFVEHTLEFRTENNTECINSWYKKNASLYRIDEDDLKKIFKKFPQFTITGLANVGRNDYNVHDDDIFDFIHDKLDAMLKLC